MQTDHEKYINRKKKKEDEEQLRIRRLVDRAHNPHNYVMLDCESDHQGEI